MSRTRTAQTVHRGKARHATQREQREMARWIEHLLDVQRVTEQTSHTDRREA